MILDVYAHHDLQHHISFSFYQETLLHNGGMDYLMIGAVEQVKE